MARLTGSGLHIWALAVLSASSVLALAPGYSRAGNILPYEALGQDSNHERLDALATFTAGTNSLLITLTNKVSNPRSAGQAISGIILTLNINPLTVAGVGDSGNLINVGSGGLMTSVGGRPDRWEASGHIKIPSANQIELLVLGGGKPSDMIIGMPASDGKYDNANSSITKNFGPWIEGTGTFSLAAKGITPNTRVTGVTILFGTGPDTRLAAQVVPEPSSLLLCGACLGSLGICRLVLRRNGAGRS